MFIYKFQFIYFNSQNIILCLLGGPILEPFYKHTLCHLAKPFNPDNIQTWLGKQSYYILNITQLIPFIFYHTSIYTFLLFLFTRQEAWWRRQRCRWSYLPTYWEFTWIVSFYLLIMTLLKLIVFLCSCAIY